MERMEDRTLMAADLRITLADQPTEVIAGHDMFYDVAVQNFGPDTATNVLVNMSLPQGTLYLADTSGDGDGASVTTTGTGLTRQDDVEIELGDLPSGAIRTFQVKARVPADMVRSTTNGAATITNTATVSSDNVAPDPDPSDNTDSELTFVTELADVAISTFVEPVGTVRAGDIFVYTIYLDNYGPSTSRNAFIRDTFLNSGDVSIQSCAFSVSQGGGAVTQFTCTTGPVVSTQFGTDAGTFQTNFLVPLQNDPVNGVLGRLRASFRLVANRGLDVTSVVRAGSSTPDPNPTNNTASVDITVVSEADLQSSSVFSAEVHVTNQPSTLIDTNALPPMPEAPFYNFGGTNVTAGRRIEWTTSANNTGPSPAENVQISVLLPYKTSLIENTLNGAPVPGQVPGRCYTQQAGELRTEVICVYGTLQPTQSASLKFQLLVDIGLPAGTQLSIDTITTSDTLDDNRSNNVTSIQFDTNVDDAAVGLTKPDLKISKDAPATAELGTLVTFAITVDNDSLVDAQDVVVQDFLPAGTYPISYTPSVGSCLAGVPGDALRPTTCNLGKMAGGASEQIIVEVLVGNDLADLARLFNDALVSSSSPERNPADNVVHSTTTALQTAGGNVTAIVKRGTLFINGDKFNNKLRIEDAVPADPNAFRITPVGGTKLNGQSGSFQVHGVRFSAISFGMGDGNDTLLFEGPLVLPKNLLISLGQGADRVELTNATVKANMSIRADGGDDVVRIVDSLLSGRLDLLMGDGNDHVEIDNSTVQGAAKILTDGGNDDITIVDTLLSSNLEIRTGAGDDQVTIDNSKVSGKTLIKNDGNTDLITIVDSIFAGLVDLQGGKGLDTLDAGPSQNNSFALVPKIKGFETILP
jgi:uncharacterized repeat protein (TIGR01451 family)